jgi:hypothetical protein
MEDLLNIKQVGNILGLAPRHVIELVRRSELPAYRTYGGRVDRETVSETTFGLRFRPSDVEEYLNSTAIR